jgi:hypothetical protein
MMNEKIKEIMYKVDDINILNEVGTDADFLADIDPQRLEKFAELIIKECIEQIETCFAGGSVSMDDKPIWNPSVDTFKAWNWGLKCSRKHIKEVFGVK